MFRWFRVLSPFTLSMAEAGGAAAPAAGAGAPPAGAEPPKPVSRSIGMSSGDSYAPIQPPRMTDGGDPAAGASGDKGGDKGGKPKAKPAAAGAAPPADGAGADSSDTAGANAPVYEPGVFYKDGKPVGKDYIPLTRLQEEIRRRDAMLRASGIDPETGAALKPAAGAAAGGDGKPGTDDKGAAAAQAATDTAEPAWKKELLPLPSKDGKPGADGKLVPWDDLAEYTAALARVEGHNAYVEAAGKAADARAREEKTIKDAEAQTEWDGKVTKLQTELIPAYAEANGMTVEQFQARAAIPEAAGIVQSPANQAATWGFLVSEAANPAALMVAIADASRTAEGAAELRRIAALPTGQMVRELIKMDDRVGDGRPIFKGAPEPGAAGAAGGEGDQDLTTGAAPGKGAPKTVTSAPPPPAKVGGGAGTNRKTLAEMTSSERIAHWKEQDRQKRAKKN